MARTTPPKPWKPGESGNPKGRPPGRGQSAQFREALASKLPAILESVVKAAIEGDMTAARLVLDRCMPTLKPMEATIEGLALPTGTLTQQARDILASVSRGEVAPGQAAQLIGAVGSVAKLMEVDELSARIEALEKAHANT
jgi:hypothetical protein